MPLYRKLFVFSLLFFSVNAFSQDLLYHRARIWFDGKPLTELSSLGIDISEGDLRQGLFFSSDFSEKEIARIQHAGFRVEITIADVEAFYLNQNKNSYRSSFSAPCPSSGPSYGIPVNFNLGSMGGYFTLHEMDSILDLMASMYPQLISTPQLIDTIHTFEGRQIRYVKVSDNPTVDENEPEVLYTALHHAREPESLSQMIFYLWYLLENYSVDPTVKALVDHTEMYFIPCLNPDGYVYNETTNPMGGGMWRKNRRDNMDGTYGVDINRNYDFQWGFDNFGSSDQHDEETYRGSAPFSEPETQAIRNFVNSRELLLNLNYHTFGDHHITPWGFTPDSLTPDPSFFVAAGNEITRYNHYHVGTTNQTLNYLVNGVSDDWFYGEQSTKEKVYSMTPEIGRKTEGFWPPAYRIIPLAQENVYANLMLAKLALRYGKLDYAMQHYTSSLQNVFDFTFTPVGLDTSGTCVISLIPQSSNIISAGSPVALTFHNTFQPQHDSISYTLSTTIHTGEEIKFVVIRDNGIWQERDTISLVYGTPSIVLTDDGSSMSNWDASFSSWDLTTEQFTSPASSLTDSPYRLYYPTDFNTISLLNALDLTGATDASLTFSAKWAIEKEFDYVQFRATTDSGASFFPLCGNYTTPGALPTIQDEPVYSGFQEDWVREQISLNDFLGSKIQIYITAVSDDFNEYDGFYLDDLKVEALYAGTGIASLNADELTASAFPNPSRENVTIAFNNNKTGSILSLYDDVGRRVYEKVLSGRTGQVTIPLHNIHPGIYNYCFSLPDGSRSKTYKLVVAH